MSGPITIASYVDRYMLLNLHFSKIIQESLESEDPAKLGSRGQLATIHHRAWRDKREVLNSILANLNEIDEQILVERGLTDEEWAIKSALLVEAEEYMSREPQHSAFDGKGLHARGFDRIQEQISWPEIGRAHV